MFQLDDEPYWAKLAKTSDIDGKLLFVDKNGEKKSLVSRDTLAGYFRNGRAALSGFDNRSVSDLVLSKLFESDMSFHQSHQE